jgi:hypothetical protein
MDMDMGRNINRTLALRRTTTRTRARTSTWTFKDTGVRNRISVKNLIDIILDSTVFSLISEVPISGSVLYSSQRQGTHLRRLQ